MVATLRPQGEQRGDLRLQKHPLRSQIKSGKPFAVTQASARVITHAPSRCHRGPLALRANSDEPKIAQKFPQLLHTAHQTNDGTPFAKHPL